MGDKQKVCFSYRRVRRAEPALRFLTDEDDETAEFAASRDLARHDLESFTQLRTRSSD
jgi:hypothetical protein